MAERVGEVIQLRSTAAGHPLPLVTPASGAVDVLGEPGTLLGTLDQVDLPEARTALAAGDALVLYTDGATEPRYTSHDGRLELLGDDRLHFL
jgi:sigma-B regulation protein RsbU (phosphoserine phosphatase)